MCVCVCVCAHVCSIYYYAIPLYSVLNPSQLYTVSSMEYLCSLYSHFFSFFFFLKKDRMENKLNELLPLCFDFATMNETLNELLPLCFDFATMKES